MSQKLSTILVGVDFSEPSFNAVSTAVNLAIKEKAALYLVYAHETIFERIVLGRAVQENPSNSYSILSAMASDISRKSGVKTEVVEDEGHAPDIILEQVIALHANLIVMGNYGASGFRSGYTGTTAYTVAKYAPCPVLLVPAGRQWNSFTRPIYPIRPVMTAMRHYTIIRQFLEKDARFQIFGLTRNDREKDETLVRETLSPIEETLRADKVTISIAWNNDHAVSRNVLAQAEKHQSDLVVLTTAIDVSNKQFFIGPISHYIIHHARIPVLVINKVNQHVLSQARSGL